MKTLDDLRDCPIPELLEILANQHETGCLRVEFEPQPAFFYVRNGELVDAQMSFLKGFAAVHLAFSRARAPFSFDRSAAVPESAISDEHDRFLLSTILGLTLSRETCDRPATGDMTAFGVEAESTEPKVEDLTEESEKTEAYVAPVEFSPTENEIIEQVEPARGTRPSGVLSFCRQLFRKMREKLVGAATIVLLIGVQAVVGTSVRLAKGNSEDLTIAAVSLPDSPQPQITVKKVTDFVASTSKMESFGTPSRAADTAPVTKPAVRQAASQRSATTTEAGDVATRLSRPAQEAPSVDSVSKIILVQVRLEQGRVTEAWVADSKKGLEAFEATAIRLARQRRYSADATRTESVSVDVKMKQ